MEVKTGEYEILVRWNCEKGEAFGHIRGVHLVTAAYLVDDDGIITGRVDRGVEDNAKEFTEDQLPKLFGNNFAMFAAQLNKTKTELEEAQKEIKNLSSKNAEHLKSLEGMHERHERREKHLQLITEHFDEKMKEKDDQLATVTASLEEATAERGLFGRKKKK